MLVSTDTAFAIRCPQCGKLETISLSRFAMGGKRSVRLDCSCGGHKLTAGVKGTQVWLQIPCYLCDGLHFAYFSTRSFWDPEIKPITCSDTDLQLGVFGPPHAIEHYAMAGGSELDRLMEDEAFAEYFDQPELMYQALSHVHGLAEDGRLSCVCGNRQIGVDIFPDRLDLTCTGCGRQQTVLVTTEEELDVLEHTTQIEVGSESATRRKGHKK